MTLSNIVKI